MQSLWQILWKKYMVYSRECICTHGTPTAKIMKKIQKNNHVNLCSTRDPIHTHTVINRFRAIAPPPRGHRRQAQRSCPLWEEPPEGILDIFLCALVFFLFLVILAVGIPWVQIFFRGYTIDFCQSLLPKKNKGNKRDNNESITPSLSFFIYSQLTHFPQLFLFACTNFSFHL